MRKDVNLDVVLTRLGKLGRWQVRQLVFLAPCLIPLYYSSVAILFVGYEPPHRCRTLKYNESTWNNDSTGNNSWISSGKCRLVNEDTNESTDCLYGYQFDIPPEASVASQWSLFCSRGYLLELSQLAFTAGRMVGSFFWSILADLYGRKPIYTISFLSSCVAHTAIIFSPNILVYSILRFMGGLALEGQSVVCFIIVFEYFTKDLLTRLGLVCIVTWTVAIAAMPAIAYPLSHFSWRYVHVVIVLSGTYIFYQIVFVLDESVRWLLATKKYGRAVEVLKKIAKTNNVTFDEIEEYLNGDTKTLLIIPRNENTNISNNSKINSKLIEKDTEKTNSQLTNVDKRNDPYLDEVFVMMNSSTITPGDTNITSGNTSSVTEMQTNKTKTRFSDLFIILKHHRLRCVMLILLFIWLTNALTYYGLILMSNNFVGDRFLNFSLGALVEMPGIFFIFFTVKWFSNRKTCIIWHFFCTLFLVLAIILVNLEQGSIPPSLQTVCLIAARMCINTTFISICIFSPQVMPTLVRSLGLGCCLFSSGLGHVTASFASYFAKRVFWAPVALFSVMCLISGLLCIYLPETHNRPLPQTIQDFEALYDSRQTKEIPSKNC